MKNDDQVGFLTVAEVADLSWDGAYLITDLRGNPSRFYRSAAPVRIDRWQRLLLGKGLRRCVYVDLLGRTLVEQDLKVVALIVDTTDLFPLRPLVDVPLGCWQDGKLEIHASYPTDSQVLAEVEARWDLVDGPLEVFDRLREAMREPVEGKPEER